MVDQRTGYSKKKGTEDRSEGAILQAVPNALDTQRMEQGKKRTNQAPEKGLNNLEMQDVTMDGADH
jgi:hypothetical protein